MSPASVQSCIGVNHRFYRLAMPVHYRYSIRVSFNPSPRLTNPNSIVPKFARSALLVTSETGDTDYLPLIAFVKSAGPLRKITIKGNYAISQNLLSIIEELHPHCELELNPTGYDTGGGRFNVTT